MGEAQGQREDRGKNGSMLAAYGTWHGFELDTMGTGIHQVPHAYTMPSIVPTICGLHLLNKQTRNPGANEQLATKKQASDRGWPCT